MLYYTEIFASIQGESRDVGEPCVFVRLYGCNIGCSFCDTKQKRSDRRSRGADSILNEVLKYHIPHVCITGGEPLLQPEIFSVVYALVSLDYKVSIETSGCVAIEDTTYNRSFRYIMDIKCPSSNVSHKNVLSNLGILMPKDDVVFVIGSREDYDYARSIVLKYPTRAALILSPVFKDEKPVVTGEQIMEWLLADRILLPRVRVMAQMHKILNCR